MKLALIGSIRDELLNGEELALWLIDLLKKRYPARCRSAIRPGKKKTAGRYWRWWPDSGAVC